MKMERFSRGAVCLLLVFVVLDGGCWGRKFFKMPHETLDTSTKVDSLLKENAKLQRRLYQVEKTLKEQRGYIRSANAQFKIDLEEFKDQLNALLQKLGEVESVSTPGFGDSRFQAKDTTSNKALSPETTAVRLEESVPPPEEIHRQIYLDFSRGEYRLVLEESDLFVKEYADHPLGEEVHFIRGECFIEQKNYFDALKEFSLILQMYPRGKRVPAALFRMAVSYESIGDRDVAAGVVRRLIREYPYSEEAGAAEERFHDLLGD